MTGRSFKGDLSEISLPDILEFVRSSRKTGILTFRQDRIRKSLHIKEGNVIFASSNLPEERLGDLLLSWGMIDKEHFQQSAALLTLKKRQGRILVEMGAITPKQLWESVQKQIRHIVYSLFNWHDGVFYFAEGDLPTHENITADVNITDLVVEGIRRIKNVDDLQNKFPSRKVVLVQIDSSRSEQIALESFEKHVLELVDGKRTFQEICRDSEIGDLETIRVLYMLLSIGYISVQSSRMNETPEQRELSREEASGIIGNYNRMYSYLYRYMMREVGPITEHVLNKYLMEIRESNSSILKNVSMRKDGTLDGGAIQGNLEWFRGDNKKDVLISSLNEFLYSSILAVKRTLGPEHESRVIETLKDIRPEL
ncbi:DUF4388 domain-containing protein [bacterium]|nr:DUF4388 domain-containing protein [bacterium]MCI0602857.1 DUF4388 domain-containing protein [bacterium]